MIDTKLLSSGDDTSEVPMAKHNSSYEVWIQELSTEFASKIDPNKFYNNKEEKDKMVDSFIKIHVSAFLRKYIGHRGDYDNSIREIRNLLKHQFSAVQRVEEDALNRFLAIMACKQHVEMHPHFYNADGID